MDNEIIINANYNTLKISKEGNEFEVTVSTSIGSLSVTMPKDEAFRLMQWLSVKA